MAKRPHVARVSPTMPWNSVEGWAVACPGYAAAVRRVIIAPAPVIEPMPDARLKGRAPITRCTCTIAPKSSHYIALHCLDTTLCGFHVTRFHDPAAMLPKPAHASCAKWRNKQGG